MASQYNDEDRTDKLESVFDRLVAKYEIEYEEKIMEAKKVRNRAFRAARKSRAKAEEKIEKADELGLSS